VEKALLSFTDMEKKFLEKQEERQGDVFYMLVKTFLSDISNTESQFPSPQSPKSPRFFLKR
jgi:hypothetical protein